jgi:hypothetical protein
MKLLKIVRIARRKEAAGRQGQVVKLVRLFRRIEAI